jgi:signal transduction histidine kinase
VKLRSRFALSFAGAVAVAVLVFGASAALVLYTQEHGKTEEAIDDVKQMIVAMLIAAPIAIAGAAVVGAWLARRALRPLLDASARVRAARASELDLTLPVGVRGDEWDDLAKTLNSLLVDARDSLSRIRTFTADAAHEMRTPLTAIIGEVDVTLRRERSAEELRAALSTVRAESTRLARVLEALLTLARADAGSLVTRTSPEPLEKLAREAASQALGVAQGSVDVQGGEAQVQCEPTLLLRALRNLIENGLTHGGGQVEVLVSSEGGMGRVLVRDGGPGIDGALGPQLFQRFRRGDRSRSSGGIGLGLSLARALVEAQGGSLRALTPARGAEFELRIPLAT